MIIASVVFLLAVGVTLLAWHVIQLSLRNSSIRTFEEHAARIESAIQDRMRGYEQVLRGGAGLFAASLNVTSTALQPTVPASIFAAAAMSLPVSTRRCVASANSFRFGVMTVAPR